MLFGKRDKKKQPNERVLDLKARVDALRHADEASRAQEEEAAAISLDHFLSGDDVLTGREVEDTYRPEGASAAGGAGPAGYRGQTNESEGYEVDLEAELQKYLQRQETLGAGEASRSSPASAQQAPEAARHSDGYEQKPQPQNDGTGSREDRPVWLTAFPEDPKPSSGEAPWPGSPEHGWAASKDSPGEDEWPGEEKAV